MANTYMWWKDPSRTLVLELRNLNSARANAKSDKERIALSDRIIVLKRELRARGVKV